MKNYMQKLAKLDYNSNDNFTLIIEITIQRIMKRGYFVE